MTIMKKAEWVIDHNFDRKSCRHSVNGSTVVLHCHHYSTLYCQLADDAEEMNGRALLRKAAEMSFLPTLADYFAAQGVDTLKDRVTLAEEYWKMCGMGTVCFERVGKVASTVRMDHSHVDEGWVKKWGQREKPVNFITQGYLAAALAAIYGLPEGSFKVTEVQSIVSGAPASRFEITRA